MASLVDRLRIDSNHYTQQLQEDAADEIERLREALLEIADLEPPKTLHDAVILAMRAVNQKRTD